MRNHPQGAQWQTNNWGCAKDYHVPALSNSCNTHYRYTPAIDPRLQKRKLQPETHRRLTQRSRHMKQFLPMCGPARGATRLATSPHISLVPKQSPSNSKAMLGFSFELMLIPRRAPERPKRSAETCSKNKFRWRTPNSKIQLKMHQI